MFVTEKAPGEVQVKKPSALMREGAKRMIEDRGYFLCQPIPGGKIYGCAVGAVALALGINLRDERLNGKVMLLVIDTFPEIDWQMISGIHHRGSRTIAEIADGLEARGQ